MRVLVCGSRTWFDAKTIYETLAELPADTVIIHGAGDGADTLADIEALSLGFGIMRFPAAWRAHGKAAGPIRNQAMVDTKPDRVIAFRNDGESRGTDDTIRRARKAGIPVTVIAPRREASRR